MNLSLTPTLVSRLRRLMRRATTSKYKKLTEIKRVAREYGWKIAPKKMAGGDHDGGDTDVSCFNWFNVLLMFVFIC